MKKIVYLSTFLMSIFSFVSLSSCSDDDMGESIFDTASRPLDKSVYTFPLDTFIKVNFFEPYNMRFIYRFEDKGSNMDYNLMPCSYEKAKLVAALSKYLWYDVYAKTVDSDNLNGGGVEFLKKNSPRIINLVGSAAYNPTQGTRIVGTAEGGLKITLYETEHFYPQDIDSLNRICFHVMHHEFSHILHQKINVPETFYRISNGKYNPITWAETPDSVALSQGFISGYASSQYRDDWAELMSIYITADSIQWANTLASAEFEWEFVKEVNAEIWTKLDKAVKDGKANRDTVGYFCKETSNEQYMIQRKCVERMSGDENVDYEYTIPNPDGSIHYTNNQGFLGRDVIEQKLAIIRDWLRINYSMDLDAVRREVQKREYLTDENGHFVIEIDPKTKRPHFVNNLVYIRPDGTTVLDSLMHQFDKYKELQKK